MRTSRLFTTAAVIPIASFLAVATAHAQDTTATLQQPLAEGPEATAADSDIVVTARRRAESMQKVPVAVTVIGGETLKNVGALTSQDVARLVPSLYVGGGGFGSTSSTIALRGITNPASNISFDPSVGTYVDEVALARNYGTLFDYFDISNVQVLRGVQGTLFGRNNVGGAILISTTKPKPINEMIVTGEYGNYNSWRSSAVVNVSPAPGLLALRFGLLTHTRDGYGKNVATGERLFDKNSQVARFSALLTPSANTEFQLTGEYSIHDETGPAFTPRSPTGRSVTPGLGFYQGNYDGRFADKGDDYYVTGHARIDFGAVELKAIGNYLEGQNVVYQDVDATRVAPNLANRRLTKHDQYSGELQLSGKLLDGRVDWILGGYHLKETGSQPTVTLAFNSETLLFIENKTTAGFGHIDFKPIDGLQIGGGVRYTKDEKGIRSGSRLTTSGECTTAAAVRAPGAYDAQSCLVALQKNDGYWSYDANVNYQATRDVLVYARTGRGQKSGGFNSALSNVGDLQGYEPEIGTDYELGVKSELFDRRLRVNVAAFQTDYKDIQRLGFVVIDVAGVPTTAVTISNAAKARIRGIELEVSAHLTDSLTIDGNYSHLGPKYLSFTGLSGGVIVDQRNYPFQQVSRNQGSASVTYTRNYEGVARLNANVNYAYRSRYELAPVPDELLSQKGYGMWNAQLRIAPQAIDGLEISAFVRNLTSEKYWTAGASAGTVRFVVAGQPRMYGLGATYRFGD